MRFFLPLFLLLYTQNVFCLAPTSGFELPDSVREMTFRFKTVGNLIALPMKINDSIEVNLILDTACKNMLLFGKRFTDLLKIDLRKTFTIPGLGSKQHSMGWLSIDNRVDIQGLKGEDISIMVIPGEQLLSGNENVDGVIGYQIFHRFEIELDFSKHLITLRRAEESHPKQGFVQLPLILAGTYPVINSLITTSAGKAKPCHIMIDTGSALGLLVKTKDENRLSFPLRFVGVGLNGEISGNKTITREVSLNGLVLKNVPTRTILSHAHHDVSLGMEVLKNYHLIINYSQSYVCLKKL